MTVFVDPPFFHVLVKDIIPVAWQKENGSL